MRELSLHLLDIAENSVAAGARTVTITVREDLAGDRLALSIQDDGKGMDAATVARVTDPFVTSRTTRKVGLGLPLLKEAAEMCNGFLRISSTLGVGTLVEVEFQHSHIDRMPLGDLAGTLLTLLISAPAVHWIFVYQVNDQSFVLDDAPIKAELADVPLSEPSILSFLREEIVSGIACLQPEQSSFTLN
jgi:hypothetical protein